MAHPVNPENLGGAGVPPNRDPEEGLSKTILNAIFDPSSPDPTDPDTIYSRLMIYVAATTPPDLNSAGPLEQRVTDIFRHRMQGNPSAVSPAVSWLETQASSLPRVAAAIRHIVQNLSEHFTKEQQAVFREGYMQLNLNENILPLTEEDREDLIPYIRTIITALQEIPEEQRQEVISYVNSFTQNLDQREKQKHNNICSIIRAVGAIPAAQRPAICADALSKCRAEPRGSILSTIIYNSSVDIPIQQAMQQLDRSLTQDHDTRLIQTYISLFSLSPDTYDALFESDVQIQDGTLPQSIEELLTNPALRTLYQFCNDHPPTANLPLPTLEETNQIIPLIMNYTEEQCDLFADLLTDHYLEHHSLLALVQACDNALAPQDNAVQPRVQATPRKRPPNSPAAKPGSASHNPRDPGRTS